jgi:hypothetical protein
MRITEAPKKYGLSIGPLLDKVLLTSGANFQRSKEPWEWTPPSWWTQPTRSLTRPDRSFFIPSTQGWGSDSRVPPKREKTISLPVMEMGI